MVVLLREFLRMREHWTEEWTSESMTLICYVDGGLVIVDNDDDLMKENIQFLFHPRLQFIPYRIVSVWLSVCLSVLCEGVYEEEPSPMRHEEGASPYQCTLKTNCSSTRISIL